MEETALSGREYAALQALFALRSGFETVENTLADRAKQAGVWDELQQLSAVSKTVMDALLLTVPRNKLQHILINLTNTKVYIKVEAPGLRSKDGENMMLVPAASLDYVLNAMVDNYCLMCDKTEVEGRKCPHRQAMEGCLPHAINVERGSEKCKFSDLALGFDSVAGVGWLTGTTEGESN